MYRNYSECVENNDVSINFDEIHKMPTPLLVIFVITSSLIVLLTIFGNCLILLLKTRIGRLGTTILVWNLGLTDLLVGLIVLPLAAIYSIRREWSFGRILCRLWVAADVTFCTCSVITICTISIDRYLAVTRPLQYKLHVTPGKMIVVVIAIWCFSLSILLITIQWKQSSCINSACTVLCSVLYVTDIWVAQPSSLTYIVMNISEGKKIMKVCYAGNEIRFLAHSVVVAFFIPAMITLILYWKIYKVATRRRKELHRGFLTRLKHNMNLISNSIAKEPALRVHFGPTKNVMQLRKEALKTHQRIAKTLGVVSLSFLVCWLPFFTLYLMSYCNSMLNPIIYAYTIEEFKQALIRLMTPSWKFMQLIVPGYKKKQEPASKNRFPPRARSLSSNRWEMKRFKMHKHTKKCESKRYECEIIHSNESIDHENLLLLRKDVSRSPNVIERLATIEANATSPSHGSIELTPNVERSLLNEKHDTILIYMAYA